MIKPFRLVCCTIFFLMYGSANAEQFNVLLFTTTTGYHHQSISAGVEAIKTLAEKHYFSVSWEADPDVFNDKKLKDFHAVIFLNTAGNVMNAEQDAALQKFIQAGNGFVGIHMASYMDGKNGWYKQLVGRSFIIHPEIQSAKMHTINTKFPGMERFPQTTFWTEEWYEFGREHAKGLQYLLTVDESTFDPRATWAEMNITGDGMGKFHPIAWFHEFDGGRSFYTALGHAAPTYSDPLFLEHIYGGIYWAATGRGL